VLHNLVHLGISPAENAVRTVGVYLALLVLLPRRPVRSGVAACRIAMGFGIARAMLECLRDPATTDALVPGVVTLPQAAALLLAGAAFWLERRLRHAGPSIMPPARRTLAHGR